MTTITENSARSYIHISHNDLDGVGCTQLSTVVLEKLNGWECLGIYNVGNHEVDSTVLEVIESISPDTLLFITDVSVSDEVAKAITSKVLSNNLRVLLFDHHKTAEYLNQYFWASVVVEKWGVKASGTSLLMDYFVSQPDVFGFELPKAVIDYAEYVRQYDTWDWVNLDDKSGKKFNDLLYLLGAQKYTQYISDEFDYCISHNTDITITDDLEMLLDIEQERINNYVKSKAKQININTMAFTIDKEIKSYNVGVVTAEQYFSELGNELCVIFPECDFIAMVDVGKGKVSLRTNKDDIDVSLVAKSLGGGGHKAASGCMLDKYRLPLFLPSYF